MTCLYTSPFITTLHTKTPFHEHPLCSIQPSVELNNSLLSLISSMSHTPRYSFVGSKHTYEKAKIILEQRLNVLLKICVNVRRQKYNSIGKEFEKIIEHSFKICLGQPRFSNRFNYLSKQMYMSDLESHQSSRTCDPMCYIPACRNSKLWKLQFDLFSCIS